MWTLSMIDDMNASLEHWIALADQRRFDELADAREEIFSALITAAHRPGMNKLAVRLGLKLDGPMRWRGHWDAWYVVLLNLLLASQAAHDVEAQAQLWERIGTLFNLRGEQTRALAAHQTTLHMTEGMGAQGLPIDAWAWGGLIDNAHRRCALDEAFEHMPAALEHAHLAGAPDALANVYMVSANVYGAVGDNRRALEYAQMAYLYWRRAQDAVGMAKTLHSMSIIYYQMGHLDRAMYVAQRAAALYWQVKSIYLLGLLNVQLGNLYRELGKPGKAEECYTIAIHYLEEQDCAQDLAIAYQSLGAALADWGRSAEAEPYLLNALHTWRDRQSDARCACVLYDLGLLYRRQGRRNEARGALLEALHLSAPAPDLVEAIQDALQSLD